MRTVRLLIVGQDLYRTRAIVCAMCSSRILDRGAGGGEVDRCSISKSLVASHVHGKACPRNKQADDNGWVRWLWIRWVGIPYPVRVWKSITTKHRGWFSLPGCGCALKAKRLSIRIRASVSDWCRRITE